MCKWLFEVGAAADITKTRINNGATPMWIACQNGHLSVCEWLFEVGADITKARDNGCTPLKVAFQEPHPHLPLVDPQRSPQPSIRRPTTTTSTVPS